MTVQIVRATNADWERVREVRLRALDDAPWAFASRLEDERDRPEGFWRARSEGKTVTFLALEGRSPVGLVGVHFLPDDRSTAHLFSMWVAPGSRRRGIGRRLLEAVVDWARGQGAARVELWVTETHETAKRLYLSCGFVEGAERQPLPSDPSLSEVVLWLGITSEPPA